MNAVLAASRPRVGTSSLAGLGLMAGFFLRRNWIRLVVWLAVVVVMMDVVAAYYKSQFNTPTALGERAMLAGSVGMRTVFGTVTSTGLGAAVWSEMWMFTACLLAIGRVPGIAPAAWLWIAAIAALAGAFVERWLFFAQARHIVALYY